MFRGERPQPRLIGRRGGGAGAGEGGGASAPRDGIRFGGGLDCLTDVETGRAECGREVTFQSGMNRKSLG